MPGGSHYLINSLKSKGAEIGHGVIIYEPKSVSIDNTRPWLIKIGSYTKITHGCIILTHDYSLSTLRRKYGPWLGEGRVTSIGENCFLGINSIILMGSKIGNNVIVGAGSVVHGVIPDDVVIGGNPARIICTLEEYYEKRKKKTIDEAIACAQRYYKVYNTPPTPKDLEGFKFLFAPRDKNYIIQHGLSFQCNGDEPSEVEKNFYLTEPVWASFEDFLKEAGLEDS